MTRFAVAAVIAIALAAPAAVAEAPVAVTIYTSLPFDGVDAPQTNDVVKGEQLALEQANSQAGGCQVTLRQRDDSTADVGQWEPEQTAANAKEAANDPSAIAYIGEFNSGASAISIPLTNMSGLVQVSPSNTALELTKSPGRRAFGAPDKYYPTGKRTYARVVPADHIQGGAQAEWMKALHVRRLFVVNDRQLYGMGVARTTTDAARLNGIRVVGTAGMDVRASNYRKLAAKIRRAGADGFFFGGITADNAVALYRDVFGANRRIKLFGPDGVAEHFFTTRIPKGAQRRMHITVDTIDPADYPGQQFFRDFSAKYGREPEPYAIYGYEAMSLILDAMNRAGAACSDRAAVVGQVFATRDRQSVIGKYSIDKDGDITTSRFGRFLVSRGQLVYDRTTFVKRDSFGNRLDR